MRAASPGRATVLFAGRLHDEKGPDLLVDALARLRSRAECILLGTGRQEDARRRRLERLGLSRCVEMPGWQPDVGCWMDAADLVVVPSRYESWSQTAVTAMAHGVPVVATNVEGLPTTLAEGRGILVPAEDPVALARAIDEVLTGVRRPDLAAARRYAERFMADRVAGYYDAVYERVAEPRDRATEQSVPLQQAA